MVDLVSRAQSVLNLIEIEQPPAELFTIGKFLVELRLTVTMTFDLLPLNFCGRLGIMCSNCLTF